MLLILGELYYPFERVGVTAWLGRSCPSAVRGEEMFGTKAEAWSGIRSIWRNPDPAKQLDWAIALIEKRQWEGDFGRGVEAFRQAELYSDINLSRMVGMLEIALPLLWVTQIERGLSHNPEQGLGAFGIDHVGRERFGNLGERRLHKVHVFQLGKLAVVAPGAEYWASRS